MIGYRGYGEEVGRGGGGGDEGEGGERGEGAEEEGVVGGDF